MISLTKNSSFEYAIKIAGNGVFIFMIEGKSLVEGNQLNRRDAIAVSETGSIQFKAIDDSKLMFIEVPMR